MIRTTSLRWRLVAGFVATMLVVLAVVFVVVYERTGSEMRAQTNHDVREDLRQLTEAARTIKAESAPQATEALRRYITSQPYSATSSLLFAVIPGHGAISNHPELLGDGDRPDHGESEAEQSEEDAQGRALQTGPVGERTAIVPDLGLARIGEAVTSVAGIRVRLGAGEALLSVTRAQRSVAKSFLIAGAVGLMAVLLAAYVAGVLISRPLRRMARVAARVDDGDLNPRMPVPRRASTEVRVMAQSFNHMLDRLELAFSHQRAFVADASHELRTPLTVIAGQLEVLASQSHPSDDEIRSTERIVAAEIARTSRLVDDLLLLTRAEHADFLRRRDVDLRTFVSDLWAATAAAGHPRRFELGPIPDASLDADPDRVAQALRNLIENAVAHTSPPDGLVRLDAQVQPGNRIRFAVSDDGPGVAASDREQIFERFHRTDEARDRRSGGAGLGLSIVRAIAEAHGGRVWVTAGPRGGGRFELELPGLSTGPSSPDRRGTSVRTLSESRNP